MFVAPCAMSEICFRRLWYVSSFVQRCISFEIWCRVGLHFPCENIGMLLQTRAFLQLMLMGHVFQTQVSSDISGLFRLGVASVLLLM